MYLRDMLYLDEEKEKSAFEKEPEGSKSDWRSYNEKIGEMKIKLLE